MGGRLFVIAYLFLLRATSDGLPIVRAAPTERFFEKAPQTHRALIGLRRVVASPRLTLKIRKRNLRRVGSITLHPGCGDSPTQNPVHPGLCPIRDFRRAVLRTTP